MTIRIRILALLSLLSLMCIGTFLFFARAQKGEDAFARQQRAADLSARLQRLIGVTTRPAFRYLRNYAARAGMGEFLISRDPAWAGKFIRDRMDSYRLDEAWVLLPDGTVVYGWNRAADIALREPPLPPAELAPAFQRNQHFSFYARRGEVLYQIQGAPIVAAADLDRRTPALGWLVVAKRWGPPVIEDMADAGQGLVQLSGAARPVEAFSDEQIAAWQPLLDQRGQVIAGLLYRVNDPLGEDSMPEKIELALFLLNSLLAVLLVAVLLHFWILRPFSLLRASLAGRDPAPLAPLLPQRNEFGQMARLVQTAMSDRDRLEQSLAERVRLGRELHDGVIQGVYGAGMALSRIQSMMERDLPAARQLLDATRADLNQIIGELRGHIEKADPKTLDATLGEAVARLVRQGSGPAVVGTDLRIDEVLVAGYGAALPQRGAAISP